MKKFKYIILSSEMMAYGKEKCLYWISQTIQIAFGKT